jgi:capsular polysaccharide biosynthesis protein
MSDNASRNIEAGPDGAGRPVTLTELLTVPRRRWRWLAAFAVLGVVAVAGYLTVFPASYTATAEVAVRPVVDDPFSYPSAGADRAVNMTVESGIATGTKVAAAVAAATHRGVPRVRDALTVEVPTDSQVLRFEYTAGSARQAVTGANAAAHGYLTVRRTGYRQQRDALLASYDTTLAGLDKKLSKAPQASDTVRSLDDQIAAVTEERATIAAIDLTPGTLTRPAARPVPSSHDSAPLYLLAGALGGALLGALAAFGRESADRRVRSDADARAGTGAPLLGVVRHGARVATRTRRADVEHVSLAIARLAATRPVMLLSARTDERRTELAADLAVALAAAGETVYLGDVLGSGDELHTLVLGNPAARPRPTAAPAPAVELDETVQFPAVTLAAVGSEHPMPERPMPERPVRPVNGRPLPVRPAGDADEPGGSGGSGGGDALARLPVPVVAVGEGRVSVGPAAGHPAAGRPAAGDTAPLVLLDAPALELDARGLRALGDAVPVLVAARHRTRLRELRRAADRLDATGTAPAGVVLIGGHHA